MNVFHRAVVLAFVCAAAGVAIADDTVRIAVISDIHDSLGSTRYSSRVTSAVKRIVELEPDLVICTGGMIAGQKRVSRLTTRELNLMWASFNKTVLKPLNKAGIPMAIAPGSHDVSPAESFEAEREAFDRQWRTRRPKLDFIDRSDFPFQYAFSIGPALFVVVESTVPGPIPPATTDWVQKILVDHGSAHAHRILVTHLGQWPVSQGLEAEVSADRELEAILQFHAVSAVLNGHNRAFFPGVREGVLHISQGNLGGGTRRLIGSDAATPHTFTVLEISAESIAFNALKAPTFAVEVDIEQLPENIRSPEATLVRADLAESQ
jgi:hypothetical protein